MPDTERAESTRLLHPMSQNKNQLELDELKNLVFRISHSLKSPLASSEGLLDILESELADQLSEDQKKYIAGVRTNIRLVNRMGEDLVEFCRVGEARSAYSECSLQEIVTALTETVNFSYPQKSIAWKIPRQLPNVYCDSGDLATVFENLLNNAAKYSRPENQCIVEIEFQELPRFYAFHVRDNGIGVSPSEKENAFELFHRGSNVGQIEGTGLGLAICSRIIKKYGGFMSLKPRRKYGVSVSFTLPKASAAS